MDLRGFGRGLILVKKPSSSVIRIGAVCKRDNACNDQVIAKGTEKLSEVKNYVGHRRLSCREVEAIRAMAWRFRNSRSCHWGGKDVAAPLVCYAAGLIRAGVDPAQVARELLCAIRCCGECE